MSDEVLRWMRGLAQITPWRFSAIVLELRVIVGVVAGVAVVGVPR